METPMPTPNPPHIEPPYPPELDPRPIEDRPFTTPRPGSARGRGSSWIGLVVAIAVVIGLVFWFGSWSGNQKMAYTTRHPQAHRIRLFLSQLRALSSLRLRNRSIS